MFVQLKGAMAPAAETNDPTYTKVGGNTGVTRLTEAEILEIKQAAIARMEELRSTTTLPMVSPFPPANAGRVKIQIQEEVMNMLGFTTFNRFAKFMKICPLAVIPIIGFAGSGKTELVSTIAFLVLSVIGPLYATVPTHVTTTNIAERVFRIGCKVGKQAPALKGKTPLVVRGHRLELELEAFHDLLEGMPVETAKKERSATNWQYDPTLSYWLLKLVQSPRRGFKLETSDLTPLHQLHATYLPEPKYQALRMYVTDGVHRSWRVKDNKTEYDPFRCSQELMEAIVYKAQLVCTTPRLADQEPWSKFNSEAAKWVVLEEAGAMSVAEALTVWGYGCRPCILAGDTEQPPPFVATHDLKDRDGRIMNMFSKHAKVSILERLQRTGWPYFELNTQYRIIRGSFDVARVVIYPTV